MATVFRAISSGRSTPLPIKQQFLDLARTAHRGQNIEKTEVSPEQQLRQIAVIKLIAAYRHRGHQKAKLDPLGLVKREHIAELELPRMV